MEKNNFFFHFKKIVSMEKNIFLQKLGITFSSFQKNSEKKIKLFFF